MVPTQTSGLLVTAAANVPIEFDYSPQTGGDPDLYGAPGKSSDGKTYPAQGAYTPPGGSVSPGVWTANPDQLGPYPAGGATPGLVTVQMTATTKAFDTAVSCATGDLWLQSPDAANKLAPVVVGPGESKVISVTITPTGAPGTQVTGNLYIDAAVPSLPPFGQTTGSELARVPYAYTIQ
jgi:hypothetical protein